MSPARVPDWRPCGWVDVMHQTCIGSSWHAAESEAKSTAMLAFVDGHAKLEYADVSSADTLSALRMEISNDRGPFRQQRAKIFHSSVWPAIFVVDLCGRFRRRSHAETKNVKIMMDWIIQG